MKPRIARRLARPVALLVLASPLAFTGCDDGIEPFIWANLPDTATLYSLARAEYVDRPGAYDFLAWPGAAVTVEALSGNPFGFDIAVTEDDQGNFVLLPTGYFPDARARSGLLVDDTATWDGIRRAPSDGYTVEEPVPAELGLIYVVRSRRSGTGCLRYGKMEILSMTADGVMEIRTLTNRNCSDRSLVPNAPEEDEEESES